MPGSSMQGVITRGAPETYDVALGAGESARVLIDQGDHDVALVLRGVAGTARDIVDRQERGPDSATLLADAAGSFAIEVQPVGADAARRPFTIRLEARPAVATMADRLAARAELLESESKQLTQKNEMGAAGGRADAALELWRQSGRSDGVASAIARIGEIQQRTGKLDAAISSYRQAMALVPDTFLHAALLNNLGVSLGMRGDLMDAHSAFQQAQAEWRGLSLPVSAAATAISEGSLAYQSGEYQVALEHFLDGLEVFEQHEDARAALALNNAAVTYRALGDPAAASAYFSRALARFGPADTASRTRTLVRLGQLALEEGDTATAERHAYAALPVTRAVKDGITEADTLDLLGRIAVASGQPAPAMKHFTEALAIFSDRGVRRSIADTLQHIGSLRSTLGDATGARQALHDALSLRQAVGLPDSEAETRYELGLAEARAGELVAADRQLAAALTLIEGVRGRVAGEYSRTTYYASRRKYFAARIDVLMRLHQRSPAGDRYARDAFDVSERERARSLVDAVRESGAAETATSDQSLAARRRDLRSQLDFWSLQLAIRANADAVTRGAAADKVDGLLLAVRELDGRIRASNPSSRVGAGPALTLAGLQADLLDDDESVILRFALGEERSYLWVAGHTVFRAITLPARPQIDRQARLVVEAVSTVRTPATAPALRDRFERESAALSAMVLGPVSSMIRRRRLLIVADGALQFVPFAALPEPGGTAPLIASREVVMLPSVSTLAAVGRPSAAPSAPATRLAVLADPVYELEDPRLAGVSSRASSPGADALRVGRLPLSAYEAESILALVPATERVGATGFAATRASALDLLRRARVVHFAAHGIPDATRPELASVVLSMYDQRGRPVDGLLRVQDLYDNSGALRADLVVLSACDTTIGKDDPGEGLMSLARGFLASGARTVVGSLYPVQEEQTLELMKAFYGELFGPRRLPPAAALRSAQMALMAQPRFRDPYFWSAFVVTGSHGG